MLLQLHLAEALELCNTSYFETSECASQGSTETRPLTPVKRGRQATHCDRMDSEGLLEGIMDSQALPQGTMHGQTLSEGTAGQHALLESIVESRLTSLERLVAMQVMFYHMAARVAAFW